MISSITSSLLNFSVYTWISIILLFVANRWFDSTWKSSKMKQSVSIISVFSIFFLIISYLTKFYWVLYIQFAILTFLLSILFINVIAIYTNTTSDRLEKEENDWKSYLEKKLMIHFQNPPESYRIEYEEELIKLTRNIRLFYIFLLIFTLFLIFFILYPYINASISNGSFQNSIDAFKNWVELVKEKIWIN